MSQYSIILPVRNGGEYVKECVNSILFQSYTDFDLIVLDNHSQDGTLEWIMSLPDPRIHVVPSDRSLSIEENWGRITGITKNEFITLIGHDDVLNKDYLATMNELILQHPGASLYQSQFAYIDERGKKIRNAKLMPEEETAEEFLSGLLVNNTDVMGTGFMMRSKDYDAMGGIPAYPNLLFADLELWIRLTEKSYKAVSRAECFSFRLHQSTTTVSSDMKFHDAFGKFIFFLARLKDEKESFAKVIQANAGRFLLFYCRGLSHRLLRTPKEKRNGLSVKTFIQQCMDYAKILGVEQTFNPDRNLSIRLARLFDSGPLGRAVFMGFKKIYPKPILK
jgi:glycosyltransferase involved in cell wall biosynthesis